MRAIVPSNAVRAGEPEKRLVDQRRRLQRVAPSLPAHESPRQPSKFGFDKWHQPLERTLIAIAPSSQQLRDLWSTSGCRARFGWLDCMSNAGRGGFHPVHAFTPGSRIQERGGISRRNVTV